MNRLEITLHDIFWSLKRRLLWIIATTLVFSLGAWVYTEEFITPVYSSKASLCVFSSPRADGQVTNSQLSSDASLANTCAYLLSKQPVAQAISEELGGDLSTGTIQSMISAESIKNTQLITVTVTSTSPTLAHQVTAALCKVAPTVIPDMLKGGELTVGEPATTAGQVSPNLNSNITTGFILGLLLSCAVVILIAVLDTTMWRQEDLERAYTIPVLGSVPSMSSAAHSAPPVGKRGNKQ